MPLDASDGTLVCKLDAPVRPALLFAGALVACLVAVIALPLSWPVRVALAVVAAGYLVISLFYWWRRLPARLVITGDGRCRGIEQDGTTLRYGNIRGGMVRQSWVVIETDGPERRRLLLTKGMLGRTQFRRLRVRLRTAVAP